MISLEQLAPPERLRVSSPKPSPEDIQKATNEALREMARAIQLLAKAIRELQQR